MIRLLVGLGNPGPQYSTHRHNVGFMVLDQLHDAYVEGYGGHWAEVRLGERDVVLLKPATYMNRSGDSVAAAMEAFDVSTEDVLVVHDELDVPFGAIKLKRGGGAGGHNGLRSIIERCGGPQFSRLRIGIGRPPKGEVSITDWVLGDFSHSEGGGLDRVLDDATRALREAVASGVDAAMNTVNARRTTDLKTHLPRSGIPPGPNDREETMTAAKKLAREYELIYILRPNIPAEQAKKVSDRILSVLEARNAKLTRVDQWGKRKLAYPIENHTRGAFVYLRIVGFSDVIAEVERNLRILEGVIRYQTVRLEGLFDLEALEVDPAEVEFHELEAGEEEEDDEPSFEEKLGMRRPEPPAPPPTEGDPAAEDEDATASATGEADEGEAAEGESAAAPAEAAAEKTEETAADSEEE